MKGMLATIIALVLSASPALADDPLVVTTDKGKVRGVETAALRKFLGIPFAAAPVGELRWKPPQPAARWREVRDASQFAPHCAQPASWFIGTPTENEDCLYLNVFTPNEKKKGKGRAVMVWIYGGGLTTGESDGYDPSELVTRGDVIVVSINYRVGALGFLAHPALTAESPKHASGNYGLMDQQAALRWVRRNIHKFGGDPDNVTVFGESAGGLSIHGHLISPHSAGLFHKAIIQSGAFQQPAPLADAEAAGETVADLAGCPDQTAACLRALPVENILANQDASLLVIDNFILSRTFVSAFELGKFNKVPVLQGSTRNEFTQFLALNFEIPFGPVTPETYPSFVAAIFGLSEEDAAPFLAEYPADAYPSAGEAFAALGTDGFFACPARRSELLLSGHVPSFAYEFNDVNAPQRFLPPISIPYGAYHASDVQYIFDIPIFVPFEPLNAAQEDLADAMVDYWTAFAKTGRPRADNQPAWPRFRATTERMLSLETPSPVVQTSFSADHHCDFWAAMGF